MSEHRFEMPDEPQKSRWEAMSAQARNVFVHPPEPNVAHDLIDNKVAQALRVSEQILDWAVQDLFTDPGWSRFSGHLGLEAPTTTSELAEVHHNLPKTLEHLHTAKTAIAASGTRNHMGEFVDETMQLVLVPWQAMQTNLDNLEEWTNKLRAEQPGARRDKFPELMSKALAEDTVLYRSPSGDMPIRDYLDMKVTQDGPWGVVLAQTGVHTSSETIQTNKSPNDLWAPAKSFDIAGYDTSKMGIAEWLAVTLQIHPQMVANANYVWLPANRIVQSGMNEVFCTAMPVPSSQLVATFAAASHKAFNFKPRLAVM